ncbi:MAG TPA: chemotaxis protein CheA [Thermoanaerobaculia bacterium]|nr:chemotaxis protein CheA [Thermoanaerobaculia bacterium]
MTAPEDLEMEFDRDALIRVFLAEAEERLAQMEGGLVLLEDHPGDEELLQAIFRAAHTLKGNSATLGFGALTEFTHVLEDLLERVRSRTLPVTGDLVSLLLGSVDVLRQLLADAARGLDGMSVAQRSFLGRLSGALGKDASTAARAPEETADEGRAEKAVEIPGLNLMTRTLRVDLDRLDQMLDLVGEIAVSRGRLKQLLEKKRGADLEEALEVHREADRLDMDLQELVMKIRMIPVGPTFHHFARTVRDLARAVNKQVRFVTEGEDVEVDMTVIERIRDPLTHMIRNAVDHGIEAPEVRAAAGKDPCGCIRLRAFRDTGSIVIQIVDDGSGLDRTSLLDRARAKGLVEEAAVLSDVAVDRLIFEPGISTSDAVTALSGRGVGMDVVRREVEGLRGSVEVQTEAGRGTTITLRLPLTLAIIDGFVVKASDETYVIPVEAVIECVDLPAGERGTGLSGVMNLRGSPLPYLRLRELFDLPGEASPRENVVVVRNQTSQAGFVVDALLGGSQIVIKPLGRLFRSLPGVAGSAIVGDGRVALILDVPRLVKTALDRELSYQS